MGNMSNPLINRWGLNLFWYRFWFTDKNYFLNLQQDFLISKLVHTFLNYGVLYPKNIFLNKYWFLKKFGFKNYFALHNTKYYRIVNFKSNTTNTLSHYFNRTKLKNIYFGKLWILRYQGWLVINFYCFQPPKSLSALRRLRTLPSLRKTSYVSKNFNKNGDVARLFFFSLLQSSLKTPSYYLF